jgi:hypothetical protein
MLQTACLRRMFAYQSTQSVKEFGRVKNDLNIDCFLAHYKHSFRRVKYTWRARGWLSSMQAEDLSLGYWTWVG